MANTVTKTQVKSPRMSTLLRYTSLPGKKAITLIDQATAIERIEMVRKGVPAQFLAQLAETMGLSKERLYECLGLPRSTIDRKAGKERLLNAEESERVLALAMLIARAQMIVEQSGDPRFDAAKWLGGWLNRPHPALNGQTPGAFMDTAEGRTLVSDLLLQQQSSAYA